VGDEPHNRWIEAPTSTSGESIHCKDQLFLAEQLLPALVPLQMREPEIPEFIPLEKEIEEII
jgi:hypothetical protein